MTQRFPSPVCEDTLSRCWEHLDAKRRKFRIRALTAKLGGFFSNLVFLFSLLFGANLLILRHFSGSYCLFLQSIDFLQKPLEWTSRLFPAGSTLAMI